MRVAAVVMLCLMAGRVLGQFPLRIDSGFKTAFDFHYCSDVAFVSGGRVMVSGEFHQAGDPFYRTVVRLFPDGAPDGSFAAWGGGLGGKLQINGYNGECRH